MSISEIAYDSFSLNDKSLIGPRIQDSLIEPGLGKRPFRDNYQGIFQGLMFLVQEARALLFFFSLIHHFFEIWDGDVFQDRPNEEANDEGIKLT